MTAHTETHKFKISIGVRESELLDLLHERIRMCAQQCDLARGKVNASFEIAKSSLSNIPDIGKRIELWRQELAELDDRLEGAFNILAQYEDFLKAHKNQEEEGLSLGEPEESYEPHKEM